MGKQENNKTRSFNNDLDQSINSDFDLDAYIQEQSEGIKNQSPQSELIPEDRSQFRNAVLIFFVFAASFLWFHDWSPNQAWSALTGGDGNETAAEVTTGEPTVNQFEVSGPPTAPVAPAPPVSGLDLSITEYLTELRDREYLGDEISGLSARQLFDANIPISYLDDLENAGFLEDLSFVYIINYYRNQIPLSYLKSLQEAGVYDELSFVDVTEFYNNGVPTEYLITLNEAGYLKDLSFVYVTNFYNAGVTVGFLNQLKDQGLYEDLNFLDIVDLYQRENGG